jgi:hypothetical protein
MPFMGATFISNVEWKPLFFAEKNRFLADRVIGAVQLTQCKVGEKWLCAPGFVRWLIRLEAAFHGSLVRCKRAPESSITRRGCAFSPFRPFQEFLPESVAQPARTPRGQEQRLDV